MQYKLPLCVIDPREIVELCGSDTHPQRYLPHLARSSRLQVLTLTSRVSMRTSALSSGMGSSDSMVRRWPASAACKCIWLGGPIIPADAFRDAPTLSQLAVSHPHPLAQVDRVVPPEILCIRTKFKFV
ncbi:hypothetical protein BC938DRAFT_481596 [Jimgerdemannia flammicorona]|uniref:Uncharacterized protein n=1 Tax=Jimgerdemannia flammicorona TaxID=994334 RepID=A0A433QX01_9FUNG|nr:hypothetical protein BC938DRAFT_481596 [Jimgerdemannia flammicorona]